MDFKIKADLSECNLGKELLKWRAFDYGGSDKDLRISDSWPRTPIGTILFEMSLWCYDLCACVCAARRVCNASCSCSLLGEFRFPGQWLSTPQAPSPPTQRLQRRAGFYSPPWPFRCWCCLECDGGGEAGGKETSVRAGSTFGGGGTDPT